MNAKTMSAQGPTLLIRANCIGRGDDELGLNLMMNFIFHLTKAETVPETIILMNSGVTLASEGSEVLDELRELERRGTSVLVCGTCLNFFNIKDQLKAGHVSNMGEIATTLLDASKVITV
ncbi:MAG: sulfurtransferase-like selenium metabolism protein YedF [Candidatus Abyssobacteria bacterium SURF_17]|uniref:Sulfurtransferase-like selenium metabolism protein YedF n=1 Tax=Candidatus Abyssobacteria bacterium SURF_17 TaxID=2093361 RepID=A0A419EPU0_9BACT|nr:MAG: sulfurtransferase-like selenium metabolism protein YedF [Candidatus Abyssubacteria bacterium SURF_17]